MAKGLSAAKAKKILTDGYVKGKPLTAKQRKYFGAIASGATPLKKINGAEVEKAQWGKILKAAKNMYQGAKKVGKFDSSIDWGKWNKAIPENKALMKEYNAIEEATKKNGTWMKNSDGSAFKGTPEQFVQENSENFKKAFPDGFKEGYRGAHFNIDDFVNRDRNDWATFLTDNRKNAESYATSDGANKVFYNPAVNKPGEQVDGIYQLAFPNNLPTVTGNANGRSWRLLDYDDRIARGLNNNNVNIHNENLLNWSKGTEDYGLQEFNPSKKYLQTDNYASYVKNPKNPEVIAEIKNVRDQMGFSTDIPTNTVYAVDAERVPLKSLMYNNGMFDMTNPNIYKAIVPGAIGTAAASQMTGPVREDGQFKNGGWLDKYEDETLPKAQWGKILKAAKNSYKGDDSVKIINKLGLDISNLGGTSKDVKAVAKKIKDRLMTDKFITNNMNATGRTRQEVVESIENFTSEFNKGSITFDDFGDSFDGVYRGNGNIGINTNNLNFKNKDDIVGTIDHEVNHLFSDSKGPYTIIDNKLHGQPLYDNYPTLKLTGDKNVSIPGGAKYQSVAPEQQARLRKAIAWLEENAGLEMGGDITEEMVKKLGKGLKEGEIEFAKRNKGGKWTAPPEEGGTFEYDFLQGDYVGGITGGGQLQKGKYSDVGELLNNLDAPSITPPGSFSLLPTAPTGSKIWINAVKDALNKTYGVIPAAGAMGAASQMGPKQQDGQFKNGGWLDKYEDGGSVPKAQNGIKEAINKYLGYPYEEARQFAENPDELSNIDNMRHAQATRLTQEAIANKTGNIPLISDALGLLGSNALGVGHELSTVFGDMDKRDMSTKLLESGEDIFNNLFGSVVGALPMDDKTKDNIIKYVSYNNMLPDGYVREEQGEKDGFSENVYFKNEDGEIKRPEYKNGGSVSWQWKGNTYSGTLIPSMENEKNRYARTKNGKVKTLPKAQIGIKLSDEELAKRYYAEQPTLSTYEEPSMYEKAMDYLGSPMTSLGYLLRGEDLPDRIPMYSEERSAFDDFAFDLINPIAYGNYARDAVIDAGRENYIDAGINAFSATPVLPSVMKYIPKNVKNIFKKTPKVVDDIVQPKSIDIDLETTPLREAFTQPNIFPTSSPLPKNMEPYLSRRIYPFNKEQEVFESFLPSKGQIRNIDSKSLYYNPEGKQITKAEADKLLYPSDYKKNGGWLHKYQEGGVIEDDRGQWAYPGEITKINSNNITMKGVNYPVLGISDTGDTQMMYPNGEYQYDGNSVTEYPMAQEGAGVNKEGVKQYKWFKNYMRSPKYKERLKEEFPDYTDKQIGQEVKSRLDNVMQTRVGFLPRSSDISTGVGGTQGVYNADEYPGAIMLRPEYSASTSDVLFKPGNYLSGYKTIPLHEWSHAADDGGNRMPQSTTDLMLSKMKENSLDIPKDKYYYTRPTEYLGRMQPLRYLMGQEGLYDAGTQDFTKEDLEKARQNKTIKNNQHFKDLMENVNSDEDFIELMNKVASIDNSRSDLSIMAQNGDKVAKDFMSNYINSPKFKERLTSSNYNNVEDQVIKRSNNIDNTNYIEQEETPGLLETFEKMYKDEPYSTSGSKYDERLNTLIYDKKQDIDYGIGKNSVIAHEYGHAAIDGTPELRATPSSPDKRFLLNDYDINELTSRLRKDKGQTQHDLKPTENKSDLDAFRFELSQQGIYDAGKEDMTKNILEKGKDSFIKKRLLKNYKEKDLIWLMNNIASVNQKDNSRTMMAKDGKSLVELDQLTNFTNYNTPQPGGWLDKYN